MYLVVKSTSFFKLGSMIPSEACEKDVLPKCLILLTHVDQVSGMYADSSGTKEEVVSRFRDFCAKFRAKNFGEEFNASLAILVDDALAVKESSKSRESLRSGDSKEKVRENMLAWSDRVFEEFTLEPKAISH